MLPMIRFTRAEAQLIRCALLRFQRDLPPWNLSTALEPATEAVNVARTVCGDLLDRLLDAETAANCEPEEDGEPANDNLPF